jgi:hypothetical protein
MDNCGKPQINKKACAVADRRSPGKPVCTFLPASPVGKQAGCEKFTRLMFPWRTLVKFFSHLPGIKVVCGRGQQGKKILHR